MLRYTSIPKDKHTVRSMTTRMRIYILLLVSLLILGAILTSYGSLILVPSGQQDRNNALMALNGEIIPFDVDLNQPFDLMLSEGVTFRYSNYDLAKGFFLNEVSPFNIFGVTDSQFQIQFSNNRMYVSALIRDSENNLIAQIVNNTWKAVDPNYTLAFWDRNYNAYAFEIIGSNSKPTLQLIMVGSNKIQIGGLFHTKNGSIYIAPLESGDAMIYVNVRPDQHLEENETTMTIFKYPALTNSSNLGKMVNPYYPANDPLSETNWKIMMGNFFSILGVIFVAIFGLGMPFVVNDWNKKRKRFEINSEERKSPRSMKRKVKKVPRGKKKRKRK